MGLSCRAKSSKYGNETIKIVQGQNERKSSDRPRNPPNQRLFAIMTIYHRFFVPDGSFIDDASLGDIVSSTRIGCSLSEGLVRINNIEIGLIEPTPRGHLMFEDDLKLTLQHAKAKKLDTSVIERLRGSAGFLLFQPLGEHAGEWQVLLWQQLFKEFPDAVLVLESGEFVLT